MCFGIVGIALPCDVSKGVGKTCTSLEQSHGDLVLTAAALRHDTLAARMRDAATLSLAPGSLSFEAKKPADSARCMLLHVFAVDVLTPSHPSHEPM